ncbi:MAG: cytochrome c oxidase accessory protein CcoG [Pseudomonadota bacterium]
MNKPKSIAVHDISPGLDLYEKRKKIYIRQASGIFEIFRTITIWLTLSVYFILPWLQWNNRQAVLFDLPARQFRIFGLTFFPQDFILLAWGLIISAFALFFITNILGRVWCGYTCPQTVWTKIFVWIEEWIEGSRTQRMRLDKSPLTSVKAFRKFLKHFLWFSVAALTAVTFLGYFTSINILIFNILKLDLNGWSWFWIGFFTLATYMNAGWMREQVCMYMCPYARFQSVMFDSDTLVISYDKERGEPRGSRSRNPEQNEKKSSLGDCIDCHMCVQVCPTGIDIRDGLQFECIGCAACIDACDTVMKQMNYAPGLVRYTTENTLAHKPTKILRPRMFGYGVVLLIITTAFFTYIFQRSIISLDVLRDRNVLYRITENGFIENAYTLKLINKGQEPLEVFIQVDNKDFKLSAPSSITLENNDVETVIVHVTHTIHPNKARLKNQDIDFQIQSLNGETITNTESRFMVPLIITTQ